MDNKKTCAWGRVTMKALSHRVSSQKWHLGPHTKETRVDRAFCVSGSHVWGRLAYIRRAQAPVTRQDTNGEGGRRLEPVGSAFMASSLVRSICDGMAPTRMYKRGCDLHGNGFACSEIHQRGFYTLNYVGQ